MSKYLIPLACCFLLISQNIFSQYNSSENGKEVLLNYEISNSTGFSFGETKPVFYINFLKNVNEKFSFGLRMGVYAYKEKLESVIYDEYFPQYKGLNSGQYIGVLNNLQVNGLTYVISFTGKYKISTVFSFGLSAGVKNYIATGYNTTFSFMKINNNYPFIVTIENASETGDDKNITRAYYSLNLDYTINRFTVGIYGDNIYSMGLNFGLLF